MKKKKQQERFYIDFESKEVKKAIFDSKSKTYKTKDKLNLPAYRLFFTKRLAEQQLSKFNQDDVVSN